MKPKKMRIVLSTTEIRSLRSKVRHRLNKRFSLLTPSELHFLNQMDDELPEMIAISPAQLEWLVDILDRTKSKYGR